MKAEQLLLRAAGTGEVSAEYFEEVCDHYSQDLDRSRLRNQLAVQDIVESVSPSLQDVKESLNTISALFSEVAKLLQLLYSVPASTASAESSLRRLKSYLRSTMTAQRLNHMLPLHVHNDLTDEINLRGFVRRNERRKNVFGLL